MLEFKFAHGDDEFVLGEENLTYIDNEDVETLT